MVGNIARYSILTISFLMTFVDYVESDIVYQIGQQYFTFGCSISDYRFTCLLHECLFKSRLTHILRYLYFGRDMNGFEDFVKMLIMGESLYIMCKVFDTISLDVCQSILAIFISIKIALRFTSNFNKSLFHFMVIASLLEKRK